LFDVSDEIETHFKIPLTKSKVQSRNWHVICLFLHKIDNMKSKIFLFFLVVPLLAFTTHKFYVSVTNITYSEQDQTFQITTRLFIDDLEELLKERYDIEAQLGTDDEAAVADQYVEKYLNTKLLLYLNDAKAEYTFLGKKYDNDVVVCYLEVEKVVFEDLRSVIVQNELLTDLFDEQKNLVHIKFKGKKKSFVLIKSDTKGMLNL